MTRLMKVVATLWVTLIFCCAGNVLAQSAELDSVEADALEFMLKYAELKQWRFESMGETLEHPTFTEFAADEQYYFENLEGIVNHYGIEVSIYYWGCNWIFVAYEELDVFCSPVFIGTMWWDELEPVAEAAAKGAYLEELGIRELKQALQLTDEQLLIDAYSEMLNGAYLHLLAFAEMLYDNPFDYDAQILDQADVDQALASAISMAGGEFEVNPGLNDAWYRPTTSGQGFFLTVYPEKGIVMLAWLTFDLDFPGQEAIASLGDPCQRWLTAQGPYDGDQAELVIYNSSGGLFNSGAVVTKHEPIGSITLKFENCESGTVNYDLPSHGLSGEIPIQRVASDNIAACVVQAYAVR